MKKCPSCNKSLADNAGMCPSCGHDFSMTAGQQAGINGVGCIVVIVGGIMMLNGLPRQDQWFGIPLCFAGGIVIALGFIMGAVKSK